MKEQEINKIMDNITEDSSMCIIREALTLYEEEPQLEDCDHCGKADCPSCKL